MIELLEILERNEKGEFQENTIHGKVFAKLKTFAELSSG